MPTTEKMQLDNIIEYPRKPHNPIHPEYQRDVYNMDRSIAENKRHMGYKDEPNKIDVVKINFAARKNIRKE
jgi:hypothetical protein